MSVIQIDSVLKHFKGQEVLQSVSLEVRDREFCVLLGPSGCGKTTLLRIIAGLERQSAGRVLIGGRDVSQLPPRQRNIAMVFQNYAVFPHLTIGDNIAFGLRMKRIAEDTIKRRIKRAAELMHIEHLLERYSGQLSGGQRQRVAVARALAVEPDVLLMDEPLSNLDALLRLEMRTELKALLRETKTTAIYVTHDQIEAMSLADRIAVMHGGKIVQYDAPATVYTQPGTIFVGGFIGNPPMNFLDSPETFPALGVTAPVRAKTLGIRPEDFDIVPAAQGAAAHVLVVEMLGSALQVAARMGKTLVRVMAPPDLPVRPDETIYVRVRAGKARWYDEGNTLLTAA